MRTSPYTNNDTAASNGTVILGVGGAGCNIVARFAAQAPGSGYCIAVNSDLAALQNKTHIKHIQIGRIVCGGLGCATAERGRAAALESERAIKDAMQTFGHAILVAGLGGGCGSGASVEILRFAKEMHMRTTAIIFMPSRQLNVEIFFGGVPQSIGVSEARTETAAHTLDKIKRISDAVRTVNGTEEEYRRMQTESLIQYFDRIDTGICSIIHACKHEAC